MAEKQNNYSLDVIKGIAVILIIFIHAPVSGVVGQYIIAIARSGVALFFMISGFYMYSSDLNIRACTKRKLIRILKLALCAYSFYFVWGIFVRYVGTGVNSVIGWFNDLAKFHTLIKIFIFHEDVLAGHLWFINALIVCYFFTLLTGNAIYKKFYLWVAVVLLTVNFLLMNIFPVIFGIEISMKFCRNGWLYGIPLFLLGIRLRIWIEKRNRINDILLLSIALFSLVIIGIERMRLGYSQLYLGNIFLLCSIFIWTIQNPDALKCKWLRKMGAIYSVYIYIIQWAVINVGAKLLKMVGLENYGNILTVIAILGSVAFAVLFQTIVNKIVSWRK